MHSVLAKIFPDLNSFLRANSENMLMYYSLSNDLILFQSFDLPVKEKHSIWKCSKHKQKTKKYGKGEGLASLCLSLFKWGLMKNGDTEKLSFLYFGYEIIG